MFDEQSEFNNYVKKISMTINKTHVRPTEFEKSVLGEKREENLIEENNVFHVSRSIQKKNIKKTLVSNLHSTSSSVLSYQKIFRQFNSGIQKN